MTPQEQQLLQGLTERINQTVLAEKDTDAEQFLQQSLSRNPDSLYILAQTVLVQQYALDNAKKQLDQARLDLDQARQQAQQQPKHASSFLGSLLGHDDPAPPPQAAQYAPVPSYAQPQYAQPQYVQPQYAQPQYTQQQGGMFGSQPAQGGGFLRSAMQTATGVAAGALAFEGIESLMHGFGNHAGYGGGQGLGGFGDQGRGETVNNYYGDSSSADHLPHSAQTSSDIEDRRDDNSSRSFADTSQDNSGNADDSDFSNDSSNDSSSDDSSDSGSSDDNSF